MFLSESDYFYILKFIIVVWLKKKTHTLLFRLQAAFRSDSYENRVAGRILVLYQNILRMEGRRLGFYRSYKTTRASNGHKKPEDLSAVIGDLQSF